MSATVELNPYGFEVVDDFGPEGRRPVVTFNAAGELVPLVFHGRPWAEQYAAARDEHRAYFAEHGYGEREHELRQRCKDIAARYGRAF